MKTYYTIYKTTNKINGKTYIGCHKTTDLDDGYMGSGKILKRAIDKHGLEQFEKEIIEVFDNPEEMFMMEATLVNEEFVKSDETYNICEGGKGGFSYINSLDLNIYGKNAENVRLVSSRGRIAARKVINLNPELHGQLISNGLTKYYKSGGKGSFTGKTHTESTKVKIRESMCGKNAGVNNSQYGTVWVTNDVINKKIKNDAPIPDGFRRGRI